MKEPVSKFYGVQWLETRPGKSPRWVWLDDKPSQAILAFTRKRATQVIREQAAALKDIRFRIVRLNDGLVIAYTKVRKEK